MIMAVLMMRGAAGQLRLLLTHGARQSRCFVCPYSAAPQKSNSGDGTTVDDGTVATLEKKAVKLEEEVRNLTARYNQAVRDSERIRNRTKQFVESAKIFGIQSLCRDLVEVADILEEAVEKATDDEVKDVSEVLSKIDGKLQRVFAKHGLKKMTPEGGNYDPYDHEIVRHVPARGKRPGSIATVVQDGYKLHGRTIRHAHVCIAMETNSD